MRLELEDAGFLQVLEACFSALSGRVVEAMLTIADTMENNTHPAGQSAEAVGDKASELRDAAEKLQQLAEQSLEQFEQSLRTVISSIDLSAGKEAVERLSHRAGGRAEAGQGRQSGSSYVPFSRTATASAEILLVDAFLSRVCLYLEEKRVDEEAEGAGSQGLGGSNLPLLEIQAAAAALGPEAREALREATVRLWQALESAPLFKASALQTVFEGAASYMRQAATFLDYSVSHEWDDCQNELGLQRARATALRFQEANLADVAGGPDALIPEVVLQEIEGLLGESARNLVARVRREVTETSPGATSSKPPIDGASPPLRVITSTELEEARKAIVERKELLQKIDEATAKLASSAERLEQLERQVDLLQKERSREGGVGTPTAVEETPPGTGMPARSISSPVGVSDPSAATGLPAKGRGKYGAKRSSKYLQRRRTEASLAASPGSPGSSTLSHNPSTSSLSSVSSVSSVSSTSSVSSPSALSANSDSSTISQPARLSGPALDPSARASVSTPVLEPVRPTRPVEPPTAAPALPLSQITTTVKLKAFFWEKLRDKEALRSGSVWAAVAGQAIQLPQTTIDSLTEAFRAQDPTRAKPAKPVQVQHVPTIQCTFDGKRSTLIEIGVTKSKLQPSQIAEHILRLTPIAGVEDSVDLLLRICPTPQEMTESLAALRARLQAEALQDNPWGSEAEPVLASFSLCDVLAYRLSGIPQPLLRLQNWSFVLGFDKEASSVQEALKLLVGTLEFLLHNRRWRQFLRLILEVGNFLNGQGKLGKARGVRLTVFQKLLDTKDSGNTSGGDGAARTEPRTLLYHVLGAAASLDQQRFWGRAKYIPGFQTFRDELDRLVTAKDDALARSLESLNARCGEPGEARQPSDRPLDYPILPTVRIFCKLVTRTSRVGPEEALTRVEQLISRAKALGKTTRELTSADPRDGYPGLTAEFLGRASSALQSLEELQSRSQDLFPIAKTAYHVDASMNLAEFISLFSKFAENCQKQLSLFDSRRLKELEPGKKRISL